jgi:hypothetical protein
MLTMRSLLTFTVVAALLGCAANGPAFVPAPVPVHASKQALVYVYRPNALALGGRAASIHLDYLNVADLSRNGYTWLHAAAGSHRLMQTWPGDVSRKQVELPVVWEAGRTYYYRLSTGSAAEAPGMLITWTLAEVSAETALREIQAARHQPTFALPAVHAQ